tara:strand:- start:103 stop:333 length:231 start_codon:yes stop_codon:yes gene_type:complete
MEHIKPLVYDFYASVILRRISYCETREEVVNFYQNDLLPELVEDGNLSLGELKKRFDGSDDYRLEALVDEIDKTIN